MVNVNTQLVKMGVRRITFASSTLILHVKTRLKMEMEKRFAIHQLKLVKIPMLLCHDLFSLGDILADMDITDTDTDITDILTLTLLDIMVTDIIPITIMANLPKVIANAVNIHTRPMMAISLGTAITTLVKAISATLTKAKILNVVRIILIQNIVPIIVFVKDQIAQISNPYRLVIQKML